MFLVSSFQAQPGNEFFGGSTSKFGFELVDSLDPRLSPFSRGTLSAWKRDFWKNYSKCLSCSHSWELLNYKILFKLLAMTQSNLLALAKLGDAKAIADVINYLMQTEGVIAKAALKDGFLEIIV